MSKYQEYPKWKYAKPAGEIEKPRSIMVANEDQENALDGEWFDTPDYKNVTREEAAERVESGIPAGYEPAEYPKWLYSDDMAGGKLVYNQGEEDKLKSDHPGYIWSDKPSRTEATQIKAWGLPEDTDLNHNDPMMAADPVKLDKSADDDAVHANSLDGLTRPEAADDAHDETNLNTLAVEEVSEPAAKAAIKKNAVAAKKTGEAKAPKTDDDLL